MNVKMNRVSQWDTRFLVVFLAITSMTVGADIIRPYERKTGHPLWGALKFIYALALDGSLWDYWASNTMIFSVYFYLTDASRYSSPGLNYL